MSNLSLWTILDQVSSWGENKTMEREFFAVGWFCFWSAVGMYVGVITGASHLI